MWAQNYQMKAVFQIWVHGRRGTKSQRVLGYQILHFNHALGVGYCTYRHFYSEPPSVAL